MGLVRRLFNLHGVSVFLSHVYRLHEHSSAIKQALFKALGSDQVMKINSTITYTHVTRHSLNGKQP